MVLSTRSCVISMQLHIQYGLQNCDGLFWSSGSVPLAQQKAITQAETL